MTQPRCTATIFGRPLADLPPADAAAIRCFLAEPNCGCPDCTRQMARLEAMKYVHP